jgi:hypothetical protein
MRKESPGLLCIALLLTVSLAFPQKSAAQTPAQSGLGHYEQMANLPFPEDQPTKESAAALRDELLYQRATQVYLWALPAVNFMAMKEASEQKFGAGYNVFPVWKKRLDAKTIVTTPNSDVIYAMGYIDVGKDGPIVIQIPPEQQGILNDFWQRPIPGPTVNGRTYSGDVGLAGPDGGKGGKFLILPPDYKGNVPSGYFVYRSQTNNVFVFWRAFYREASDLGPPNKLIEQTRMYPLGKEGEAKPMQFPDASGVPVNMDFPFDGSFFDMLSRFINSEAVDPADLDWRGMLAGIGIVKGQPFNPDAHDRAILDAGAKTGFKMARSLIYNDLQNMPGALIFKNRHYVDPTRHFAVSVEFLDKSGTFRDLGMRAGTYSYIYATSPAMVSTIPGEGARYLVTFKDADDKFLKGEKTYRLHLPANVPVANFWSATLYDALTASGLDNGQPFPSIGSRDNPAANADGSFDIYFGPTAPPGKENNWRRTVPGKGFSVIVRLYGPTEAFYNGSWTPNDLEEVK